MASDESQEYENQLSEEVAYFREHFPDSTLTDDEILEMQNLDSVFSLYSGMNISADEEFYNQVMRDKARLQELNERMGERVSFDSEDLDDLQEIELEEEDFDDMPF